MVFYFSIRICYMFLIWKCKGVSNLGLWTTSVPALRETNICRYRWKLSVLCRTMQLYRTQVLVCMCESMCVHTCVFYLWYYCSCDVVATTSRLPKLKVLLLKKTYILQGSSAKNTEFSEPPSDYLTIKLIALQIPFYTIFFARPSTPSCNLQATK